MLVRRGSLSKGVLGAGGGVTRECGLRLDKPRGQSWARRWEAGQGPGLEARSGYGGAPTWRTEPHSGVLQPQQDAVPGAGRVAAPAGCITAQTSSLRVAALDGPRLQPTSAPRARHSLLGPAFIPGCSPRAHQRGDSAQSGWAFRTGVGQRGLAGTHGLASPNARGFHVTQVNGNSPLQRKSLKKKRRLRGLTAHGAPLLHHPGVGLLWPEPSSSLDTEPCLEDADYGGRGEGAGDCFGSGFSRGQGAQAVSKNKRKSQQSQGSLLRGVHWAHQSHSTHRPPSRDPGHKWLTVAAGACGAG